MGNQQPRGLAASRSAGARILRPFPKPFPEASIEQELQNTGKRKPAGSSGFLSGAYRDRTGDLRLAKPALSQLS
jgi:hypothetical protein